jgi:LDH2 family malate/lactate/ureidoglycolate dehydrogenase
MALYPGQEREKRISFEVLKTSVASIFQACGMTVDAAELLADSLAVADLRGIHSHGVLRVPDYVKKLTREGVDPKGKPTIVSDYGAATVIDGGNTMGQISAAFAMQYAIERARMTHVAIAVVHGSNHCGAMDYFARMALANDMIGLFTTNALPTMAAWGGKEKIVGINPLGLALPGGEQGPFVLDLSFGQTAHGKIRVYAQKGEAIPQGWAFDAEGRPTTDAVAALEGLIQPIGGHKGVGLGMAMGMLSTLLSGAAYGTELGNMVDGPKAGQDGHFCMAINIAGFTPVAEFKSRVDKILSEMRNSARADGIDQLYTPGEIEAELEAGYRRSGIPLNDETLQGLTECAKQLAADVSMLTETLKN